MILPLTAPNGCLDYLLQKKEESQEGIVTLSFQDGTIPRPVQLYAFKTDEKLYVGITGWGTVGPRPADILPQPLMIAVQYDPELYHVRTRTPERVIHCLLSIPEGTPLKNALSDSGMLLQDIHTYAVLEQRIREAMIHYKRIILSAKAK